MKNLIIYFGYVALLCLLHANADGTLKIDITKEVQCTQKTENGDFLKIHYRGYLEDGTEFDGSYQRGQPFEFTIGAGNVIKGWDQGLLDMCVGEKRRLTIPPELAYGENGFDTLIPPGATISFDTELIKIDRKTEL